MQVRLSCKPLSGAIDDACGECSSSDESSDANSEPDSDYEDHYHLISNALRHQV